MSKVPPNGLWALILGGSSGFGLASAFELAKAGFGVCVVHRDRKGAMARIDPQFEAIRAIACEFRAFNTDALDPQCRAKLISEILETAGRKSIRTLLHSVAFGSLKPVAPPTRGDQDAKLLDDEELLLTVNAMGTSLLSWTRDLFKAELFAEDARVLGLTSEGNEIAWRGYAAVSTAKAALEAVSRSIAVEYGQHGIRSNIIQPGVTDTPALRLIPGHEQLMERAKAKNPLGRLTSVEDVAKVVRFLSSDDASWINGSLIRADGGERISGL
ncbi:MAG: SDR family oxidoreductase [Bdellovibrionota bacterium]|nr:MAG: SDR family oxidoreductase [Bdellovibrionota bacterium]